MEQVYFSNSESLQGSNASNQVLAQSDLWFQDAPLGGYLGYRNGTIIAILNLCVTVMPPIKSDLQFGRRCHLKNFKVAAMVAILDIGTEQF